MTLLYLATFVAFYVRLKCMYLRTTYYFAVQHMNEITWKECCRLAVEDLQGYGLTYITNEKSIRRWNISFRRNETFSIPFQKEKRHPKLFSFFPEAKEKLKEYCEKEIDSGSLSSEQVARQLRRKIIPKCYKRWVKETPKEERKDLPMYEEVLAFVGLKNVSHVTAWRWMTDLGYSYDENKKCYYTDGHERPDVVKYRNEKFLLQYFKHEIKCYRWVQLSKDDMQKLMEDYDDFPKNACYNYIDTNNNLQMSEFHVDTHPCLNTFISTDNLKYGGNLSVRKNPNDNLLMIIGQDESTYHQFTFSKKQWKGPQGCQMIMPKGEGEILMVSGYQSREFGLGLGNLLTHASIEQINERRSNQHYKSQDDAKIVHNTTKKGNLTGDPLLRFLEQG